MDQGSNKNHSPINNFTPTVTKFCVMWEGQALPHDTKFRNCTGEIVDSRAFSSWSLIHGSSWSGLIKAEPGWFWSFCDSIYWQKPKDFGPVCSRFLWYLSHTTASKKYSWWRHKMDTFSTLLAPRERNPQGTGAHCWRFVLTWRSCDIIKMLTLVAFYHTETNKNSYMINVILTLPRVTGSLWFQPKNRLVLGHRNSPEKTAYLSKKIEK